MSIYPVGFLILEDWKNIHDFVKEELFKKNPQATIWIPTGRNWEPNREITPAPGESAGTKLRPPDDEEQASTHVHLSIRLSIPI